MELILTRAKIRIRLIPSSACVRNCEGVGHGVLLVLEDYPLCYAAYALPFSSSAKKADMPSAIGTMIYISRAQVQQLTCIASTLFPHQISFLRC